MQIQTKNEQVNILNKSLVVDKEICFNIGTIMLFTIVLYLFYYNITHIINIYGSSSEGFTLVTYSMLAFTLACIYNLFFNHIVLKNSLDKVQIIALIYVIIVSISNMAFSDKPFATRVFDCINISFWFIIMNLAYDSIMVSKSFESVKHCMSLLLIIESILFVFTRNDNVDSFGGFNIVYYVVFTLPFVMMSKNNLVKALFYLLTFGCVLISNKRGAFLAVILAFVVEQIVSLILMKHDYKKIILRICSIIIITLIGMVIIEIITNEYDLDWGKRFQGTLDDGASGRDIIWATTLETINNRPFINKLFGQGYFTMGTHNDFLQVWLDAGIIGLITYTSFVVSLISLFFKMIKNGYKYANAFAGSLVIFFICSMVSMVVITPYWSITMYMFWGMIFADYKKYMKTRD